MVRNENAQRIKLSDYLIHFLFRKYKGNSEHQIREAEKSVFQNEYFSKTGRYCLLYAKSKILPEKLTCLNKEQIKGTREGDVSQRIATIEKQLEYFRECLDGISSEIICFSGAQVVFFDEFIRTYGSLGLVFKRCFLEKERARPVIYYYYSPPECFPLDSLYNLLKDCFVLKKLTEYPQPLKEHIKRLILISQPVESNMLCQDLFHYIEQEWRLLPHYRNVKQLHFGRSIELSQDGDRDIELESCPGVKKRYFHFDRQDLEYIICPNSLSEEQKDKLRKFCDKKDKVVTLEEFKGFFNARLEKIK